MMIFCKNTLHAFLGISLSNEHHRHRPCSLPAAGLNSLTEDYQKPPNILESASLKPPPLIKNDPGPGSVCVGSLGEPVSRLSSCTESLGFESCEQMEETIINDEKTISKSAMKSRDKSRYRGESKKFPPPLSSLKRTHGDNSTSFLKPVRENGRLILTQVTINRPDIFQASRQDGRLRLKFTPSTETEKQQEEENPSNQWKNISLGSSRGGGEASRRCYDLNRHHLHVQLWNQQCVTSR